MLPILRGVQDEKGRHKEDFGELSRAELINELVGIRQRIAELEAADTERKHAEEVLQHAEAKYLTLVEQLPAIIYILTFGEVNRTTYISPQVETLLGFSQAEWLADADLWIKQLHPDDHEHVLAEVRRKDASVEPLNIEYRMLARDGRVLWFHNQNVLVSDETGQIRYAHGVMLDITERKQAEEALRESKLQLESRERFITNIMGSIPTSLVVIDRALCF